tara:strand:- start:1961 stop:3307 length:1347 start_codon:yes stop_codon:yes gene_type:complete
MTWLASYGLMVLLVIATGIAVIFVLQQRRTPQSASAWVLFILLLPYAAIPLFLALGFRKQGSRFPPIRFNNVTSSVTDAHPVAQTFCQFGIPGPSDGNAIALNIDSATARATLFETIEAATVRLDIIFYLLANDATAHDFIAALTRKARRGVAVHLVLDRLGTLRAPRAALDELTAAGGEVRYFSPFLHPPDNGHLNLRNHRKMVIADRERVWAGGRNIGDEYLTDRNIWIDMGYVLRGPAVQTFLDVFTSDWDVTGKTIEPLICQCAPMGPATVQLVPSGPDTPLDALHDTLVNAIHRARQNVWIATPYFLPTDALGQALATAARRGIDVRIMLPERSNQWTADLARGAYLRDLDGAGCRILRFTPGMLHAKAGVIDDMAWIGSANFDVRSMLLNFEAVLMIYDTDTVRGMRDWFEAVASDCAAGIVRPGLLRRIAEGVFRLGAPIL